MENVTTIMSAESKNEIMNGANHNIEKRENGRSSTGSGIINILAEGGASFLHFLKSINLSGESNMLVLSSDRHYFYDERELESVRTLVNLRKLNQIKHIGNFLQNLFDILPPDTDFIGCFSDDKTENGSRFPFYEPSRLLSRFINFIDSKTDHILDRNEVTDLLESYGFKVVSMMNIDGLTYFHTKSPDRPVRLRA
jgi:hypothetical protein